MYKLAAMATLIVKGAVTLLRTHVQPAGIRHMRIVTLDTQNAHAPFLIWDTGIGVDEKIAILCHNIINRVRYSRI
jgi:hypothetical protein